MKRILATVLVVLLLLTGCSIPNFDFSGITQNTSSNTSVLDSSSSSTTTSSVSSENITIVNPPTNIGTENTVSGEKLPTSAIPLKTDTWCYDRISKEQQRIYRLLFAAANSMAYGWIDLGLCNPETYNADIAVAYRAFTYDFPEMFWVPYEYVVKWEGVSAKAAFSLREDGFKQNYIVDLTNKKEMQKELEDAAKKIASEIKSKTQDKMEQLVLLHDKLCSTVTYYDSPITTDLLYTAYGALVYGYSVCEGYARAMRYICKQIGIDCLLVTGVSKNEQHMWNLVCLENRWYHVDTTWDDTDGVDIPLHTYFNVTETQISKDHAVDPDISKVSHEGENLGSIGYNFSLPVADGEKYNYYTYYNLDFSDMMTAARKLVSLYAVQDFVEFRLSEEQMKSYEENKTAFLSALINNVYFISNEIDLSSKEKEVIYTTVGNTLYLQWKEKRQSE